MSHHHEDIRPVKDAIERRLLAIPGVNAVEISEKHIDGKPTGELSITVAVNTKKPLTQIPADERIPPTINGIPTDVVESGPIIVCGGPYKGGIDAQAKTSGLDGTLGGFVRTTGANPRFALLTNQHVLFDGTDVTKRDFRVGPTACSICSACCSEYIARVFDAATPGRVFAVVSDLVDASIALLDGGIQFLREVRDIGTVTNVRPVTAADINTLHVQKRGTTTSLTHGTIQSITVSGPSRLHDGSLHRNMRNQIRIVQDAGSERFADSGDSGALVLTNAREAVGLLFGSNEKAGFLGNGFACRIEDVTTALGIQIETTAVANDVVTVPIAMEAVAPEEIMPAAAALQEEDLQFLMQVQEELLQTEKGREYSTLIRRNRFELRRLIDRNPRVATVWRRNHGPEIVRLLLEGVRARRLEIPAVVNNQRVTDSIHKIAAVVEKYASPRLRSDLQQHSHELDSLAGRSYAQLLLALRS